MIGTTLTATLIATLILGVSIGVRSAQPAPEPAMTAEPVVLFHDDPGRMRVGDLRFTGGLVLTSTLDRFGGWSEIDLHQSEDGLDLIMLSDRGTLAFGRLDLDEQGGPVLIDLDQMQPLTGLEGERLSEAAMDAEGLARLSDDQIAISFERDHRIWTYTLTDPVSASDYARPPDVERLRNNAGMEGLTVDADFIWASIEYPARGSQTHTLLRFNRSDPSASADTFNLALDPDFGITSINSDGQGGLYMLQRYWRRGEGNRIRILHLGADQLTDHDGPALTPHLLAELTPDMTVDNFEGLSVMFIDGQTRLFVISDDNFNDTQRTLLLSFAIEPRS